jgi:hypothetical protein
MQFRDGGFGLNIAGHGGDLRSTTASFGAHWYNLGATYIAVHRNDDDNAAAQLRIRIWVVR